MMKYTIQATIIFRCVRLSQLGYSALVLLLLAAGAGWAEELPSDCLIAESFGAGVSLPQVGPRQNERDENPSVRDGSPNTPSKLVLAAFEDQPGVLPEPGVASGASAEEALQRRLDGLEAKFNEFQNTHDELSAHVEHFSHPKSEEITMTLNGRIQLDVWTYPDTSPGVNGFETGDNEVAPADRVGFRRVRFGAYGDIYETMQYRIDVDLADAERVQPRDVFIGFKELPVLQTVLIGNQKRPYCLDQWNSSNFNVFMERPYMDEMFNPATRRVGIQSWAHTQDKSWNWQYGVFESSELNHNGFYSSNHWQGQVAGRLANTLWYDESSDGRGYAHWAITSTWVDTHEDGLVPNYAASGLTTAAFRSRPEARSVNNWIDTGLIAAADNYSLLGGEGVLNLGPTQLVGEYMSGWVNRDDATQLHFHGAYAYLSYFLTGEHMSWERDTGQLGPVDVFENFFLVDTCRDGMRGGWGAWQVAVRGSYGDLSDDDVQGGVGQSVTFGLNWWWNSNARMQFNYIYGNIDDNDVNAINGINFGTYQIIGARFAMFY